MDRFPILFAGTLLGSTGCVRAQWDLPLYEPIGTNGFIVAKASADLDSLRGACDTLSILHDGAITYMRLDSLHLWLVPSCCGFPDTLLYAAHYPIDRFDLSGTSYVNGVVNGFSRRDQVPYSLLDQSPYSTWLDDWHPLHHAHPDLVDYRWMRDTSTGFYDQWLFQRVIEEDALHPRMHRFSTTRSSASAGAFGNLTYIHGRPHGDPTREPAIWIYFLERKLAGVLPDHSLTSVDGYGPFRNSPRNPLGEYRTDRKVYYVLASGEVIEPAIEGPNWYFTPPLRYYGECDCE